MAKRNQARGNQPAFPKNAGAKRPTRQADPAQNARGYTRSEWAAAGYDPEQWGEAMPAGESAPASAMIEDLIASLRGPEGAPILARIKAHPLAPTHTGNGPSAHQLAHQLQHARESTWFLAAEVVARELATEIDEPLHAEPEPEPADVIAATDDEMRPDSPVHLATCASCAAGVRFRRSSGASIVVIEHYGIPNDLRVEISAQGYPLCPYDHGEMQLADEQLVPAHDAISQVAERTNGNGTELHQPALFVTAKPFNEREALRAIAEKNRGVQWAHEAMEAAKATAKDTTEVWKREAKQLQDLMTDLARKQADRDRQMADAADRVQDAAQDAPGGDDPDETEETAGEPAIAPPDGDSAAREAVL